MSRLPLMELNGNTNNGTDASRTKLTSIAKKRVSPFYLMKDSLPAPNPVLGSNNLITQYDLSSSYNKYCTPGRLKESLADYLPKLCNTDNLCSSISNPISLKSLIERPPITGKSIVAPNDLKGFILTPGTVNESYRLFDTRDLAKLVPIGPSMGVASSSAATSTPKTGSGIVTQFSQPYDEYGRNFGDTPIEKISHRYKYKRSLDDDHDLSEAERRARKKERREKKKSRKDKKKDKDRQEDPVIFS